MFKKHLALNLIVLILYIIDRLLKFWFIRNPNFNWDFILGVLSFRLETNTGIAFGLPIKPVVIFTLTVIALFFLIGIFVKTCSRKEHLIIFSLTLIIAGAVSNLTDRVRYGYVIDYIDVPFFTIFNLADVMITAGVGLILIKELFLKKS